MEQEGKTEEASLAGRPGALSPDGLFYWSGAGWLNTLSADGRWRWNGRQWTPAGPVATKPRTTVITRRARVLQWLLAAWICAAGLELFIAEAWFSFDGLGDHFAQHWGLLTTLLAIAILVASIVWLRAFDRGAVGALIKRRAIALLVGGWAALGLLYVAADVILAEPVRAVPISGPETRWQVLVSAGFGVAAAVAGIVLVSFMSRSGSADLPSGEVKAR